MINITDAGFLPRYDMQSEDKTSSTPAVMNSPASKQWLWNICFAFSYFRHFWLLFLSSQSRRSCRKTLNNRSRPNQSCCQFLLNLLSPQHSQAISVNRLLSQSWVWSCDCLTQRRFHALYFHEAFVRSFTKLMFTLCRLSERIFQRFSALLCYCCVAVWRTAIAVGTACSKYCNESGKFSRRFDNLTRECPGGGRSRDT